MSTSAEAGPSITKEVPLSIEPVHIYTDPEPNPAYAFERERKLQDILPDGTNIFAARKPASAQLSEDVRRLWAERGDFSRFRSEDLRKRGRDEASTSSESDEEEADGVKKDEKEDTGLLRETDERVGGTIAESEFVEMRNKVLASLDVAHFSSIHAHQLLGMLLKQHRSAPLAGGAAARMGSPAPSVGGQSARSGSTVTAGNAVAKAPLGIFGHLQGGNREEEFVLDPLAIALSRTSLSSTTAVRRDLSADAEQEEEDEYDADPTSSEYAIKQAKREIEAAQGFKENKLRESKLVLETKRKAISNAAELLSDAAAELRRSQAANRERWRSLIGLHGRGWGLTAGRPLLDVERFGVTNEDEEDAKEEPQAVLEGEGAKKEGRRSKDEKTKKTAAGLQGFGTPIITSDGKVKDEGARDAWIGFGLPEAPIELRRRSIAYWADLPSSSGALTAEEIKKKLVFPDRMHRRLRVRFVLWPPASTSNSVDAKQEGVKMEWLSDTPLTKGDSQDGTVVAGQVLDQELQQASREASDELVFGDVVAQARLLPPAFGVRLTSSSVRMVLTKRLDLVVELVPTTDSAEDAASTEAERARSYAPHAALLLAFLRLGPLRKYQAFVAATEMGRRSDANARAAAIKAGALAVPKQTASRATGKADAKGVGAGGKSTSIALARLETIGPIMVGLHYWSFVHRLGTVLHEVQTTFHQRGVEVRIQLVPVMGSGASLARLTRTLGDMVDATPSLAYPGDPAPHQPSPTSTLNALQGHAKVFVVQAGHKLIASLTFSQPSLLSVHFSPSQSNGVRLTSKPLAVDLDTLSSLLVQQLSQYTG